MADAPKKAGGETARRDWLQTAKSGTGVVRRKDCARERYRHSRRDHGQFGCRVRMDCIKPGHRTRQGPGQDGQCQQAADIDKTKEEAAETHGSAPAAASTTLKVEASKYNGLADSTATSTFRPENQLFHRGDRRFESAFLQRRDGMGQAAKEMAPSSLANN